MSTMLVGSAKRVNGIGYARENPEHPAPGVRVPLAGPCVGNKSGDETIRIGLHLGVRIGVGWLT